MTAPRVPSTRRTWSETTSHSSKKVALLSATLFFLYFGSLYWSLPAILAPKDKVGVVGGTMNFAEGNYVMTNTPAMLRAMATRVQTLGVRPEIEVFDTGHLVLAKQLIREGLIDEPVMIQLCMGIPYGAPEDPGTLLSMVQNLPPGCVFSAFSIGRMQLPYVAMAALAGGNVRVGLEDNVWLARGVKATNGQLVERAVAILTAMGARILGPEEVRNKMRLRRGSTR